MQHLSLRLIVLCNSSDLSELAQAFLAIMTTMRLSSVFKGFLVGYHRFLCCHLYLSVNEAFRVNEKIRVKYFSS